MDFDLKKIAKLAKIKIADQEEEMLEKSIRDIIKMIDKINEVDLKDDEDRDLEEILLEELPAMEYRDDVIKESISNEELSKLAPKSIAGCIVVPKIVE